MYVPITNHKQKNTWAKRIFIYPHGTWKANIRCVILDWRQRSTGRSSEGERSAGCSNEGERSTGLSFEGRDPLVTQADMSAPRVCFPAVALLHKKGPHHKRKIYGNHLLLYSYYTQSLPSKNKNIHYIFIYLGVLRCLSSGAIYDNNRQLDMPLKSINQLKIERLLSVFPDSILYFLCVCRGVYVYVWRHDSIRKHSKRFLL